MYVATSWRDAVAVFSRDADDSGKLSFVHVLKDGVGGVDGLSGASSVTISPDGNNVYVASSTWDEDAVAVFSRDADDSGKLSFVHVLKDGVDGVDGLYGAESVTVSRDGNNVYVASWDDDAVAVFSRDAYDSGKLSFVHVLKDGVGGVDGLNGASSVTISPDGNYVYVASYDDDAVAIFSRDTDDRGKLSFVDVLKDGVGGVDGLNGAYSVTVSPDGDNVYITSYTDLAVFFRDADDSGKLSFVHLKNGVGGVDGLNGARSVTISPDGNNVYVASFLDDAVAVFSRGYSFQRLPNTDGPTNIQQHQKSIPNCANFMDWRDAGETRVHIIALSLSTFCTFREQLRLLS